MREHNKHFIEWLKDHLLNGDPSDMFTWIESRSFLRVQTYKINGYTFYMHSQDVKVHLKIVGFT